MMEVLRAAVAVVALSLPFLVGVAAQVAAYKIPLTSDKRVRITWVLYGGCLGLAVYAWISIGIVSEYVTSDTLLGMLYVAYWMGSVVVGLASVRDTFKFFFRDHGDDENLGDDDGGSDPKPPLPTGPQGHTVQTCSSHRLLLASGVVCTTILPEGLRIVGRSVV